jgi:hypothetical protein
VSFSIPEVSITSSQQSAVSIQLSRRQKAEGRRKNKEQRTEEPEM